VSNQRHAAVLRYFEAEFPGAVLNATPSGSVKISAEAGDGVYSAHLSREFLEDGEPCEIERRLREWDVAGEMPRMEGLEVSVSSGGVRLDSSN
jgi:hypothetical protein